MLSILPQISIIKSPFTSHLTLRSTQQLDVHLLQSPKLSRSFPVPLSSITTQFPIKLPRRQHFSEKK